jgi:hypothetical protein
MTKNVAPGRSLTRARETRRMRAEASMENGERIREIERLRSRLSDLREQKVELDTRAIEHRASIQDIRQRLGNPFFYSGARHGRPENARYTVAKYSGYISHEPGLALLRDRIANLRETRLITEQLQALNADLEA